MLQNIGYCNNNRKDCVGLISIHFYKNQIFIKIKSNQEFLGLKYSDRSRKLQET